MENKIEYEHASLKYLNAINVFNYSVVIFF